jgi:hypothetical protein
MNRDGGVMRVDDEGATSSSDARGVPGRLFVDLPPIEQTRAELAKVLPLFRKVYLHLIELSDRKIALPQPLLLQVAAGQDHAIVVTSPALELGGAGDDIDSAVEDIAGTLSSLYEGLLHDESRLDRPAAALLTRLRAILG